jgi:hypothetical protein
MEPIALGSRLARLLADPPEPEATCGRVLQEVPWPWPDAAGEEFLRVLGEIVRDVNAGRLPAQAWIHALGPGARGISAQYVDPALAMLHGVTAADPSSLAPSTARTLEEWQRILYLITEKLRLRHRVHQHLPG